VQLELNTDQLQKLVELAYLGEWMINARHDDDAQDEEATSALQALLVAAGKAGLPGVEQDPETTDYYLDPEWVERLYIRHVADYEDHVFWDELAERLAERDLARQRGVPVEEIDREDDAAALRPIEDDYRDELADYGVGRLEVGGGY